mmetsp:Transcript_31486/g.61835  ORF Transcript_31486/g.61835 Transcript_31486/m.61835 type:complete len:288 (+) Transcript_31486:70-933(+)
MVATFCSLAVVARQGVPAVPLCEHLSTVPVLPLSMFPVYRGIGEDGRRSQSCCCNNAALFTVTFRAWPECRGRHQPLKRRTTKAEVIEASKPRQRYDSATCLLVLLNVAVFLYERCSGFHLQAWYLQHDRRYFHPPQMVTSLFCHANYRHLSANLFGLYVFGRAFEEEAGSFGLLTAYFVCGVFANLASFVLQSGRIVSLGASGAVFGLFVAATLAKLGPDPRCLIEFLVFGQFAFSQLRCELSGPYRPGVDSTAHIAGAIGGLLAYWLLRRRQWRVGFLWFRRKKK